jgi:lysyl-tRNA synthetase class 1
MTESEQSDTKDNIAEPSWVTEYTDQIINEFGDEDVINIATGISLSGPVHVGHLREFMTGAVVCNSLQNKGYKTELTAFADDMDPLKHKYDFLPDEYKNYIGVPLYLIPSHLDENISYADFYLNELIDSLAELKIYPKIIKSSDIYNSGRYNNYLNFVMKNKDEVLSTLGDISGSEKRDVWPFKFVCPECHSSTTTNVLHFDETNGDTDIYCKKCEDQYKTNIFDNGGKLMWRFDWPVRWKSFNIHAEPVAQDHASKGGSYDSSSVILRKFFHGRAPIPLKYSWVKSREKTDLHTKTGVTSVKQLVDLYPPSIIWSMYALSNPSKPIYFDLKESLQDEVGEYIKQKPLLESITPLGVELSPVFNEIDFNTIVSFIKTGRPLKNISDQDYNKLKKWIDLTDINEEVTLSKDEKDLMKILSIRFNDIDTWSTGQIKRKFEEISKEYKISIKDISQLLYKYLFSETSGPNIPAYFADLPKEEVISKLTIKE